MFKIHLNVEINNYIEQNITLKLFILILFLFRFNNKKKKKVTLLNLVLHTAAKFWDRQLGRF